MRKEVKRIGVLSAMKVSAIVYALLGLIFALLYLPFIGIFMAAAQGSGELSDFPIGVGGLGVGMIILMPIMYGILGGIFGALAAFIYNLVSKWVGGYEIELADVHTTDIRRIG